LKGKGVMRTYFVDGIEAAVVEAKVGYCRLNR
jgi:hypothetical protein